MVKCLPTDKRTRVNYSPTPLGTTTVIKLLTQKKGRYIHPPKTNKNVRGNQGTFSSQEI